MRYLIWILSAILVFGCSSGQKKPSSSTRAFGKFQLRDYKETTLTNGLKVLLVEDKRLPYVTLSVLVNAGYAHDPAGKSGLTAFTVNLLDKGTLTRSASQIADDLEQLGMSLSADTSADFSYLSLNALSWNQDKALENLSEILIDPSFIREEVVREKKQFLAAIKKRIDDPSSYSNELFYSYFYGQHPYGKTQLGEVSTVSSIRRKDIISHYIKYFSPKNSWLVVTGKFSNDIQPQLEKYFSRWKERETNALSFPKLAAFKGTNIRLVHNHSLVQSQIFFGGTGISRQIPEYLEAKVANTILGDGFSSRLVKNVRVKSGLTYSIDSEFDTRKDQGVFVIGTFTQNMAVRQTLQEVMNTYKEFYEKGVTDEEVQDAKAYLSGSFPQVIETPERFAYNLLVLRVYGVPDSYLMDFQKNLAKISTEKVNKAIKKYFNPTDMKILIYSNKDQVAAQLHDLGKVEVINAR